MHEISCLYVALGLWLFVSPYALPYASTIDESTVLPGAMLFIIAGVITLIVGVIGAIELGPREPWIGFALGVGLLAAPWLIGFAGVPVAMWNSVVCGALVTAAAVTELATPFHDEQA